MSLIMACLVHKAAATEGGGSNYLPGFYGDFGMAIFPKSGTYFNNFFAAYRDEYDQTGTLLEMPGIIQVTDHRWLGGRYIAAAFPALMAARDTTNDAHYDRLALGDFYFVPGGLNWEGEQFNAFLFEGIVAPTGRYQQGDFNTGRNYWTFDHNLQLTWTLPGSNELSVTIGYMNNLENSATKYRSGDEFHFDYNIGHYFQQSIAVGVAGSHYRQVSRDEAPANSLVSVSSEASSIGPSILYTPKINNQEAAISLKWLYEFDVEGRNVQEYLICRVMLPF